MNSSLKLFDLAGFTREQIALSCVPGTEPTSIDQLFSHVTRWRDLFGSLDKDGPRPGDLQTLQSVVHEIDGAMGLCVILQNADIAREVVAQMRETTTSMIEIARNKLNN